LAEDSKNQTEESKLPSDSSTNKETEKSNETASDSPSEVINHQEMTDVKGAVEQSKDLKSADPEIQKEEKDKDSEKQAHKTVSNDEEKIRDNDHSIHLNELMEHDLFDSLRSKKDQIFRYTAAIIGVILIVYGIVLISASVTKVADNVIFGEGASFAAFSMLLGFLIIVAAFSQKILSRTFLKNINSELEKAEGKFESQDKKIEEVKGNTDKNQDKDNNGNIVGEDKK
jgi:hypothetical protein